MKRIASRLAASAILISGPAMAAQDMGLQLHSRPSSIGKSGMGIRIGAAISLGGKKQARTMNRVAINLNAGPIIALQNDQSVQVRTGDLIGFRLKPGKSVELRFAGRSLATSYTKYGAAQSEDEPTDGQTKKKKGPSTIGWVGIVVGGALGLAAIATVGLFATCNYSFSDNCRGPSD